MLNRDIYINTFDGGIDLDSDSRVIPSNKTREAYNTDIRRSGNVASISDLKGETILSKIDETISGEIFVLAAIDVRFYEEPTKQEKEAILVFYINGEDVKKFIIKAVFESSVKTIFEEALSEEDYLILKDSTIDYTVVGQFSYDIVYFVDNRRQPRKLECVITNTNELPVTISLDSIDDNDDFNTVSLTISIPEPSQEDFVVYVYGYKKGGATRINPINPLTDTIKSTEFISNGSSENSISFDIYKEDYDDWVFQIVYHREGNIIYRNFVIGDPFLVEAPIGVLTNTFLLKYSSSFIPSNNQIESWDFIFDGANIIAYSESPTIVEGVTKLYKGRFKKGENLLSNGFYQSIITSPDENKYIQTAGGVVSDYETNNGNLIVSFHPSEIEATARSSSTLQEGLRNRLSSVTQNLANSFSYSGDTYNLVSIITGSVKRPDNVSYQIQRAADLSPLAIYENASWPGCGSTVSDTETSQSYLTKTYPLRFGGATIGNTISFSCNASTRPNRFSIKFNGTIIASTSWLGAANYSGPWGSELPLGNPSSQSISVQYSDLGYYELQVEVGNGNPSDPSTDNFSVTISCPS